MENIGKELNLQQIALTYVPSMEDIESEVNLNKINPTVANTFILYRQRAIIDKYINLKPTSANFQLISLRLDKTKSHYFNLPVPQFE